MFKILIIYILLNVNIIFAEEELNVHNKWSENWPGFNYPKNFILDDRSFKGEKFKWIVQYNDLQKKVSIKVVNYGYVSEIEAKEKGFSNFREYFLSNELQNCTRELREDFEIFTEVRESYTRVIFLGPNATWGNCYKQLYVNYPKGEKDKYLTLIKRIKKSFHMAQKEE